MFPIYHGIMLPESSFVGVLNSYIQDSPDFPEGADFSSNNTSVCSARFQDGNAYMYCEDSDLDAWIESSIGPNGTSWTNAGVTTNGNYGRITSSLVSKKYLIQAGIITRYLYLDGEPTSESPSPITAYSKATEDPITGEIYLRWGNNQTKKFNGTDFYDTLYVTDSLSLYEFSADNGYVYSLEAVAGSINDIYLVKRDGDTGLEDSRILLPHIPGCDSLAVSGEVASVVLSSGGELRTYIISTVTGELLKYVALPDEELVYGYNTTTLTTSLVGNILYVSSSHSTNKHVAYEISLGRW